MDKIRYLFSGTLTLETPLHIGSVLVNQQTDSPVRTDTAGSPLIPGTTLGGVLRTQAERFLLAFGSDPCLGPGDKEDPACDCLVCQVFGSVNPTKEENRPSRLTIRDAGMVSQNIPLEIRDGIGISRLRQTVGQKLKFDWQVIPKGTQFRFEANLETAEKRHLELFCVALGEFQSGRAVLGGRSGRGMGRLKLSLDNISEVFFGKNDLQSLKEYLKASPEKRFSQFLSSKSSAIYISEQFAALRQQSAVTTKSFIPPNFIELELLLKFDYGLLINNPAEALLEASDNAFVRTAFDHNGQETLYLPGSSLRGLFRSQAERIARTISYARARTGNDPYAGPEQHNYKEYSKFIAACDPLVLASKEKDPTNQDEEYAATACAFYLKSVMDDILEKQRKEPASERSDFMLKETKKCSCLGCQLFGNTYLGSRLKISDAYPMSGGRLDPQGETKQRMDFVAIDRFTGGARDTAKFEANPHFSRHLPDQHLVFRTTLTLTDITLVEESWMLGWLAYLISDLVQGDLRLGLGKAKGFGKVSGKLVRVRVGGLSSKPDWFSGKVPVSAWKRDEDIPGLLTVFELDLVKGVSSTNTAQDFTLAQALLKDFAEEFDQKIDAFERKRAVRIEVAQ